MPIYVQYDPSEGGYFSAVTAQTEPTVQPPKLQIAYPDNTDIFGMMLDLTQNPPVLIPIPPSPSPSP